MKSCLTEEQTKAHLGKRIDQMFDQIQASELTSHMFRICLCLAGQGTRD